MAMTVIINIFTITTIRPRRTIAKNDDNDGDDEWIDVLFSLSLALLNVGPVVIIIVDADLAVVLAIIVGALQGEVNLSVSVSLLVAIDADDVYVEETNNVDSDLECISAWIFNEDFHMNRLPHNWQ